MFTRRHFSKVLTAGGICLTTSLATGLATCGRALASPAVLRAGYQKYGTFVLLKEKGFLDRALQAVGVKVEWSQFPAGPPLLQAMAAGALDIGQTGDLPPIFLQANVPKAILYFGHEPKAGSSEAIIVREEAPIHGISDLKGRTIAVTRGSDAHWLLLSALEQNGLSPKDVHISYLFPAAARPAFEAGKVDAWAIWDPYLSSAGQHARTLITGNEIHGAMEFYLCSRTFSEDRPDILQIVKKALTEADSWAQENREEVVKILAASTGLEPEIVRKSVSRITFRFQPMDEDTITQQEEIARAFYKAGLISTLPDIRANIAL
jgi:sulfonate transport system substrate-binding protein